MSKHGLLSRNDQKNGILLVEQILMSEIFLIGGLIFDHRGVSKKRSTHVNFILGDVIFS